jgi:hypothetical protein
MSLPATPNGVAQGLELLAVSPHPGLMLGRCAFGLQALFLDLSLTLKINGLLALRTVGNDAGGEHWHEASSHRVGDESAQVGHGVANVTGLEPSGQFVEQGLGLLAAVAQQQSRDLALSRQQLVWKNKFTTTTTTGRAVWRARFARAVLLLY